MKKSIIKIKTPAYNNKNVVDKTVKSDNYNNTPPIWGLTQIRDVEVIEDNDNVLSEEQKKNVKLLVSLTGNGVINGSVPPYQSGTYTIVFDDTTAIYFITGFNSNYGFGLYKYKGLINNLGDYTIADINWMAQASGGVDMDTWTIILKEI